MEDTLQTNNSQNPQNQPVVEPTVDNVEMADRTKKEFEKLTTSNKTLHSENEQLKQRLEALENAKTAPLPQPTIKDSLEKAEKSGIDPASYVGVDPKTGERFVDENKLEKLLENLQSKTTQVEEKFQTYVQTTEQRRQQQQREIAFKAYPELEPESNKFDKKFYRRVKETIYGSMLEPTEYGKVLTIKEAADYVKGEDIKSQEPQGDKPKDQENQDKQVGGAKADAGTQVPSSAQTVPQAPSSDDLRVLRLATRKGNVNALAHRLLATDHVLKTQK